MNQKGTNPSEPELEGVQSIRDVVSDGKSKWAMPMVSSVTPDGRIVEMTYDPAQGKTAFAVFDGHDTHVLSEIKAKGQTFIPYSPYNNLVRNEVILFPSKAEEYGTTQDLVNEIRVFIHRYMDISDTFEHISAYYVLLTWVYDAFNELPYLRIRGDYGSGKTRFLLTVGSICCKPIFASGASTVSPLFRMLEAFRGTLIVDEGDFRFTDERADLVKILNNGNARGFPVLRCDTDQSREFNPKAYSVYGPKLVAMRGTSQ